MNSLFWKKLMLIRKCINMLIHDPDTKLLEDAIRRRGNLSYKSFDNLLALQGFRGWPCAIGRRPLQESAQ